LRRRISDHQIDQVLVVRKRCWGCGLKFRHYPVGVNQQSQSDRLVYALGISYSNLLAALGCRLAKSTVWLNVQKMGAKARRLKERHLEGMKIKIVGLDTTIYKVGKERVIVGLVSDILAGKPIVIKVLTRESAEVVKQAFRRLFSSLGVEVVVTDDAGELVNAVEGMGVKHQICLAHLHKSIKKRQGFVLSRGFQRRNELSFTPTMMKLSGS
jgi:hypothetical protein